MNNGNGIDNSTIITCLSISGVFFSLYFSYDRNITAKKIGDFLLLISPGKPKKERILFGAFPPLVVLFFGLLFRYWDFIVK
jgi:hypothetical protein